MNKKIVTGGTGSASIQASLLRFYGFVSRPVGHRGMQFFTWRLGRLFDERNHAWVTVADGARVRIRLNDGYWARILLSDYRYEPELDVAVRSMTSETYFLDCGANVGYWSAVAATSAAKVVAVEASPPMYEQLLMTSAGNRSFETVHAAVWDSSGQEIEIVGHPRRHAGASVVDRKDRIGQDRYFVCRVPTRSIDDLVDEHFPDHSRPLLIKLDVEGAEIAALRGAVRTLAERPVTILYEDHGKDTTHAVSRQMVESGLSIFDADSARALTLSDISARKIESRTGYNFLAKSR